MLISASRRTDIPAYYSPWFFQRLEEGFVLVRQPRNPKLISRISLSKEVVDGFVFWTKNPIPLLQRLEGAEGVKALDDYPFYVQFTLNPYGKEVEPHVPSKNDTVIPAFQRLSQILGKERVLWRYDPILFNATYTMDYHKSYFSRLAERLSPYTTQCTLSFLDIYHNTGKNTKGLGLIPETTPQIYELMEYFSHIAKKCGISLYTCGEDVDLTPFQIQKGKCVDGKKMEAVSGVPLLASKDKNQRSVCTCCESVDIGMYDSCGHGCLYCYANSNFHRVGQNMKTHDPLSPLLFGQVQPDDVVKDRLLSSCQEVQLRLF